MKVNKLLGVALCALLAACLQWDARAATTVTSSTPAAWSAGEYVVSGDATIASRIEISGNVTLTLTSGTLTAPKGIHVGAGAALTIRGTSGKLVVNDVDYNNAGIGGDVGEACGNITISGGTVPGAGGYGAAGIGNGTNVASGGSITISGGTVNATGGGGGAGIGGGFNPYYVGRRAVGPDITITGGNVTAIGGFESSGGTQADGAAGIGGGGCGAGGTIRISGGTVHATGSEEGPGIGAGYGTAYGGANTSIEISGSANVTATGGENGAGIGAASDAKATVRITGGTVNVKGGAGAAGIGSGGGQEHDSTSSITISGGNVTAEGGAGGAGIGSGTGSNGGDSESTVTISGGTVRATGGSGAAGIGGGNANSAATVSVTGGSVTATAGSGATASVSAGQRGSGTVSVAGLSAAELNSASISVGGASNNGGTSSLPNTGVDDDRALYALLFAFSALCACASLRLARRKHA